MLQNSSRNFKIFESYKNRLTKNLLQQLETILKVKILNLEK